MVKTIHDIALQAGRRYQSEQTGLIHFCYTTDNEMVHDTIPIVENFLFVYTLLRSRIADNMTEAKILLTRLLYAQNREKGESEGNFPIYLHQYPTCHDRLIAIRLLPIFYWISHDFSSLLGAELKERFQKAYQLLEKFCQRNQQERTFSYPFALCYAAATKDPEAISLLEHPEEHPEWWETESLGWMFLAFQMHEGTKEQQGAAPSLFWEHLASCWQKEICSYTGPTTKEWQERAEPATGLYDLVMGFLSGQYPHRALDWHPRQMWASLFRNPLHPFPETKCPYTLEGEYNNSQWRSVVQQYGLCTVIARKGAIDASQAKTFTPLRIAWGNHEITHTFVCQGDGLEEIAWKKGGEEQVEMAFRLCPSIDLEDKKQSRELSFYVDKTAQLDILVEGKYATTFSLGQVVTLQSEKIKLSFILALEQGQGDFMGHIMPGNRPSQISTKGNRQYETYDWHIFLRTLRRNTDVVIRAQILYAFVTP